MGLFNDWKRKRNGEEQNEENNFEFYEDTHDSYGAYVGDTRGYPSAPDYTATPGIQKQQYEKAVKRDRSQNYTPAQPYQMPTEEQYISPRNYQNVVVYQPSSPEDVQTLIDFLKRREPAIVNLDEADPGSAQRILDFISGAIYALNGSVHRVAGNIFLLSPEGVEITVPYEKK